jgi:hypothetical protein
MLKLNRIRIFLRSECILYIFLTFNHSLLFFILLLLSTSAPRICESENKNAPLCASVVMEHMSLLNTLAVLTLFEHNHLCETPLYLVCFRGHPDTLHAILSSQNMIQKNDVEKQRTFLRTIGKHIRHIIVL